MLQEPKELNSFNLLAFQDQQFDGFGAAAAGSGSECTCVCTCGEPPSPCDQNCDGANGEATAATGENGQCAGIDRKYRGGMTLDEARDWFWCHDKVNNAAGE